MTEGETADRLVVDCVHCSGLGSKVRACACTGAGDTLLVSGRARPGSWEPFAQCHQCAGTGSLAEVCHSCSGTGKARAQVDLSAVNAATAQVASATVTPGALVPVRVDPDWRDREWVLPIDAVLRDLAGQVGIDPEAALRGADSYLWRPIRLDAAWDPDLDPEERWHLEAAALATDPHRRHLLHIGLPGTVAKVSPDQRLAELASLAEALRVDLVVWRHAWFTGRDGRLRFSWWTGLATPDFPLPAGGPPGPNHGTLRRALAGADPTRMVDALPRARDLDVPGGTPGHYLTATGGLALARPGRVSALVKSLAKVGGVNDAAAAIWRDGAWHTTKVRIEAIRETFTPIDTGQVRSRHEAAWALEHKPPAPSWQAGPIPSRGCPDCETGTAWARCRCVDAHGAASVECKACSGSGQRPANTCGRCGKTGRVHTGAVLTVTDAVGFTRHVNLQPELSRIPGSGGTSQGPIALRRLDTRWRLARVLEDLGIDPADVVAAGGATIGADVLDGITAAPVDADPRALERVFCEQVSRGWAAGRVFWRIRTGPRRGLAPLVSVAHAFGLDIALAARHRDPDLYPPGSVLSGTRWAAAALEPAQDLGPDTLAGSERSSHVAIDHCWNHLANLLNQRKSDPAEPLNAPQQTKPDLSGLDGITDTLDDLARRYASDGSQTVAVRIASERTAFMLSAFDEDTGDRTETVLAEASTFREAADLLPQ